MSLPRGEGGIAVVGVGAGALDIILPAGETGSDHVESQKGLWRPEEDERLADLVDRPGHEAYLHVGGNIVNALSWLALQRGVGARFVGVTGEQDPVSRAIRSELARFDIEDASVPVRGYQPSISFVERLAVPGSDRMIRGRKRDLMEPYLSDEHLRGALDMADVVAISSSKSPRLNRRLFEIAYGASPLSFNPGSSEFSDPNSGLERLMSEMPPDLLTANDDELRELFGDSDSSPEKLAERAGKLATNVVCTLGKHGVLFAFNGQVSKQKCSPLGVGETITDKMGAGDRAHAVAIYHRLILGEDPDNVLEAIDRESTKVIQHEGAHGDLYTRVVPVTYSLAA